MRSPEGAQLNPIVRQSNRGRGRNRYRNRGDDVSFGHERLDVYRGVTRTRPEYTAVRIDPDADTDSDPEDYPAINRAAPAPNPAERRPSIPAHSRSRPAEP
jgi:hypothetical protein